MDITYGPTKNDRNMAERGLSFECVRSFEWDSAIEVEDTRRGYSENGIRALGYIGDRLYMLVYTRRGSTIRIVSLRKANAREIKRYAET